MQNKNRFFTYGAAGFFLLVFSLFSHDPKGIWIYGATYNGLVCGYSEVNFTAAGKRMKKEISIEESGHVRLSLRGIGLDVKIHRLFRVEPVSGDFFFCSSESSQGHASEKARITVRGGVAIHSSGGSTHSREIHLASDVKRENPFFFPHLVRDFIRGKMSSKTYRVLDIVDAAIHEKIYRKIARQDIHIAGKTFPTLVLDAVDLGSGAKSRLWVNVENGMLIKEETRKRTLFLATASVESDIGRAPIDSEIMAPVNRIIKDVLAVSSMKISAVLEPEGSWFTEETLNGPGQTFVGHVLENRIEGVFDIHNRRYNGTDAPPFPLPFRKGDYLEPEVLIESDAPEIVSMARQITQGAADSWEAAKRLCRWVAENISYDLGGGNSARDTFGKQRGECAAHSLLLAAFCRALNIPARVVWGCMYSGEGNGRFVQHAWNEILMGEAGWIGVDSTARETNGVDSARIRLGELRSKNSRLHPEKMEILEYQVLPSDHGTFPPEKALENHRPFLGDYTASFGEYRNVPFRVVEQNGGLGVDVPGKMVFALKEPDAEGERFFQMSDSLSLNFCQDDDGNVCGMTLTIRTRLPRKSMEQMPGEDVPDAYRPCIGRYVVPMEDRELDVVFENHSLALSDVDDGIVALQGPDAKGFWKNPWNDRRYFFPVDEDGKVKALAIIESHYLPKGKPVALALEKVLMDSGIEAAQRAYDDLMRHPPKGPWISEESFNQLGYKLLEQGKVAEAIYVFELTVSIFQQSWNAYDSLAEAYLVSGNREKALANYEHSLALNPHNGNARKVLKKMKEEGNTRP